MRANFSGVWKLNRGESDFSFLPPPQLRIDTIIHEEPALHIRTRQKDTNGDITIDRLLAIGAEPVTFRIRDRERQICAYWEEPTLVVETTSEVSGNLRRIKDRWTLDDSGQWLSIERVHEQPGGPVRQHLRLRRREDAAILSRKESLCDNNS